MVAKDQNLEIHMTESGKLFFNSLRRISISNNLVVLEICNILLIYFAFYFTFPIRKMKKSHMSSAVCHMF